MEITKNYDIEAQIVELEKILTDYNDSLSELLETDETVNFDLEFKDCDIELLETEINTIERELKQLREREVW